MSNIESMSIKSNLKVSCFSGALLVVLLFTAAIGRAAPVISLPGTLTLTVNAQAPQGTEVWDYTYSESGWSTVVSGLIMKPVGGGPYPSVQLNHGKGGNATGFGLEKGESWFIPAGYMIISVELTHAGQILCLDAANLCGGSRENVRRARRAAEILSSQQLIDQIGEVVDRNNIYIYGNSLGALTALELAQDLGSRIRAVALSAGGIVLNTSLSHMSPGGADAVTDVIAPVIQMHGRLDNIIKIWEAEELNDALNLYDKEHQMVWFPNAGHNIARQRLTTDAVRDFILDWFDTYENNVAPLITAVTPNQGVAMDAVMISGIFFGNNTNNSSQLNFNGTPAGVVSWSETTINTIVPESATSGGLQVIVPTGPITDPEVEQPVEGGVRSNRVYFDILF